jgi:hypothetical protein
MLAIVSHDERVMGLLGLPHGASTLLECGMSFTLIQVAWDLILAT